MLTSEFSQVHLPLHCVSRGILAGPGTAKHEVICSLDELKAFFAPHPVPGIELTPEFFQRRVLIGVSTGMINWPVAEVESVTLHNGGFMDHNAIIAYHAGGHPPGGITFEHLGCAYDVVSTFGFPSYAIHWSQLIDPETLKLVGGGGDVPSPFLR